MTTKSTFMGFESLKDLFQSLLGLKSMWAAALPSFLLGCSSFITGYVYESVQAVVVLWVLMLADWITGVWKSCRNKSFVSYRLMRMPLFYLSTSFVLAISWNISKSHWVFIPLPGIILGSFYSTYFISLLENLGELGYLPKTFVSVLKSKFGFSALMKKFKDK